MADFTYKTYRCAWVTECYEVDQYGQRQKSPILYGAEWPTRELAMTDLERVATRCSFTGRWIPKGAPHGYTEAGVAYREVLVKNLAVAA